LRKDSLVDAYKVHETRAVGAATILLIVAALDLPAMRDHGVNAFPGGEAFMRAAEPGEALVNVGGQPGKAMADQIMAADKARLKSQLGTLSRADMLALEGAILVHLGMPK
jgi:hypothetical protein